MNSPAPDLASLWDFDNPAASEAAFREVAGNAGLSTEYRAEALTQLARAQGLQRRFDEADSTLLKAKAMLTPAMNRPQVRIHLERGRILNSSGHPNQARTHFIAAWEAARAAALDALAVDAAHMVAITLAGEESLTWNQRALALARASGDPHARRWLGSLYNNIGWTLHDSGRHEEALAAFTLALEERQQQGAPAPIRIARWCIARTLRSLGRPGDALAMQRQLLAEHAAAGTTDGFIHEEIAECLLQLGQPAEARPHFAQAHEALLHNHDLAHAQPARLERLARLASPPSP